MFFINVDIINNNKLNPTLIIAIYNKRKKHKTMKGRVSSDNSISKSIQNQTCDLGLRSNSHLNQK